MSENVDSRLERYVSGYGLLECDLATAVEKLGAIKWPGIEKREISKCEHIGEILKFLSPLTWPANRHVLFSAGKNWTCMINNRRGGSDLDGILFLATKLGMRVARVVNRTGRTWRRGKLRLVMRYAARIFELVDPDGSSVKTIYAADDGGRWAYGNSGDTLPVEAGFNLDARRKKDRFTADNLRSVCECLGLAFVEVETLAKAREFVCCREIHVNPEIERRINDFAVSVEQEGDPAIGYLRRAQGLLKHLDTHASSVISDLEKALEINPDLQPEIAPLLARARTHDKR